MSQASTTIAIPQRAERAFAPLGWLAAAGKFARRKPLGAFGALILIAVVVASVFAPYYCAKCDHNHRHLVELNGNVVELEEQMVCPQCGGQLEFDDIAQTYLGFAGQS